MALIKNRNFFYFSLSTALRQCWRQGYSFQDFFADLASGLTVCAIAVPFTMGVAIACGVPPEHGLYGAIIAGPLVAFLGGSRLSVTGPVAELAVLIYPVVYQYGFSGLMVASWMAGIMLLMMGLARLGRVIEFIPYPVTTGFIAGTGVVICSMQIKDFFGLTLQSTQPKHFIERIVTIVQAFPSWQVGDALIGVATVMTILVWPKIKLRLPSYFIAMIVGSVLGILIPIAFPDWTVQTIGTRYGGIPRSLPSFMPFLQDINMEMVQALFVPAFAIAMLCSIKALLCAVVLDGMKGTKHDPNAELIAHGISNLVLPFFGGLASTSALSRSVANLRAGARSPLSSIIHGTSIIAIILLFAQTLSYLPMATLAALLLVAAWNIFDVQHCLRIVRLGTRSDVVVLLICFGLTVLLDMALAVGVGTVLAALLFMKRMAKITGGRWLLESSQSDLQDKLPPGVMIYEVSGPLFFGAAEKAMSTLREHSSGLKTLILQMGRVPTIDINGMVALQSSLDSMFQKQVFVVLSEVQEQPKEMIEKAHILPQPGRLAICRNIRESLELAKQYA